MRIVAGVHRSRKLHTLEGNNTRPTQDKIKEAMFSSLGSYFDNGVMLDLFAGSGSVGLEAISRGMEKVYFSDNHKAAIQVIQENCSVLKEESKCIVENLDYKMMLERYKQMQFDFIFVDPPYALKVYEEILWFLSQQDMLKEHGCIVLESDKKDTLNERYGAFIKTKEKIYGITKLTYYKKENT